MSGGVEAGLPEDSDDLDAFELVLPRTFGDVRADGLADGLLNSVWLFHGGLEYRMSWCTPDWLAGRLGDVRSSGKGFFEPNLVVVPDLTAGRIADAARELVTSGRVNGLTPATTPVGWRETGSIGRDWLRRAFSDGPACLRTVLANLGPDVPVWVESPARDANSPRPPDLAASNQLAASRSVARFASWLNGLPDSATLFAVSAPDEPVSPGQHYGFVEDHLIRWSRPPEANLVDPTDQSDIRVWISLTTPGGLLEQASGERLDAMMIEQITTNPIAAVTSVHDHEALLVAAPPAYSPAGMTGRPPDGEVPQAHELAVPAEHWTIGLRDGTSLQVLAHGYQLDGEDAQFELLFKGSPNVIVPTLRIPLALLDQFD